METRMEEHYTIRNDFGFDNLIQVVAQGNSGGITIMWKNGNIIVDQIGSTDQEVHAMIKVPNNPKPWLISIIYASSLLEERLILWENLKTVAHNFKGPWLVTGDFNEVTRASEKFGGLPVNNRRITEFLNCLGHCGLIDLGFKFTWTNKR